jgi:hypothetical protein
VYCKWWPFEDRWAIKDTMADIISMQCHELLDNFHAKASTQFYRSSMSLPSAWNLFSPHFCPLSSAIG